MATRKKPRRRKAAPKRRREAPTRRRRTPKRKSPAKRRRAPKRKTTRRKAPAKRRRKTERRRYFTTASGALIYSTAKPVAVVPRPAPIIEARAVEVVEKAVQKKRASGAFAKFFRHLEAKADWDRLQRKYERYPMFQGPRYKSRIPRWEIDAYHERWGR
jgi:hypothetical protein